MLPNRKRSIHQYIKTEALGRSAGPVQNVIMALLNARS